MRRLLDRVLDGPLAEADARDLFASWRIGLWLGLLVALAGGGTLVVAGLYLTGEAPVPQLVARHGIGRVLVASVQAAFAVYLTVAVPIRTAGLVEGPRWRGFFDQLVASGLEPWRYVAGRALVAQVFLLLAFAATVPLVTVFAVMDPPPAGAVLEGYAYLAIYAELLLAVTLGLSMLVHEVLAVLLTIALGAAAGACALAPIPSALAALSPLRGIATELARAVPDEDPAFLDAFYGAPRPFGVELPMLPYAAALSALLGAVALASCLVGPLHAFVPGFNGFGAIVVPGDAKRAAIRRVRPVLARRAELAFFFENRGPVLDALAPWIRAAQPGVLLALAGTLGMGAFLDPDVVRFFSGDRPSEEVLFAVLGPLAVVAGLAPFVLASSRTDAAASARVGRLAVPVVLLELAAYALAAAWLVSVAFLGVARFAFVVKPRNLPDGFAVVRAGVEWAAILMVVGFTLACVQKVVGLRTWGRVPAIVLALALVLSGNLLQLARGPRDLEDPDESAFARATEDEPLLLRSEESNARALAGLHLGFAFRLQLAVRPRLLDDVRLPGGALRWLAYHGFWVTWPALDLLLLVSLAQLVALRRREAAAELARVEREAAA